MKEKRIKDVGGGAYNASAKAFRRFHNFRQRRWVCWYFSSSTLSHPGALLGLPLSRKMLRFTINSFHVNTSEPKCTLCFVLVLSISQHGRGTRSSFCAVARLRNFETEEWTKLATFWVRSSFFAWLSLLNRSFSTDTANLCALCNEISAIRMANWVSRRDSSFLRSSRPINSESSQR